MDDGVGAECDQAQSVRPRQQLPSNPLSNFAAAAAQPFAAVTCTAKAATKNSILLRCAEIDLLLL